MRLRKEFRGLHAYRLKGDNPKEEIAAKLWQEQHPEVVSRGTLPYLLGDGKDPVDPSDRDWLVAATLMQWLGSPIGESFVRSLVEKFDMHDRRR